MRAFSVCNWMMSLLLFLLCFCHASSYFMDRGYAASRSIGRSSMITKYDRINEVTKQCSSVMPSVSDMKPAGDVVRNLKEELSFLNGDWWQESPKAPFMPFNKMVHSNYSLPDSAAVSYPLGLGSPSNLVSFWVTDISSTHRSKTWVAVNGAMVIGTTTQGLFMEMPNGGSNFDIWPGHSQQTILFQGIYAESDKNGGERVMCLLGNAMRPSRDLDSADQWEEVKQSAGTNPLLQDDYILLVLQYPKAFNLLNRSIRGSMKSLNQKSDAKYFDEVRMSSWLAVSATYEFGSQEVSTACDPYPYKDNLVNGDFDVYKGLDICEILEKFTRQGALRFVPNSKCNGTDEYCSKLGPFKLDKDLNTTDGSFKDFSLVIQDFRCDSVSDGDGIGRISSVFRAFPASEELFFASQKTGANNMTLSAEGIWKSSSGQVCMVGCLGRLTGERGGCKHRICLYVPLSFSIKQRSTLVGTFSSIDGLTRSYYPLAFKQMTRPGDFWDQSTGFRPHYNYSKIDAAVVILEKNERSKFGDVVKKSLLKFPKLDEAESYHYSLSLLSEDLTLHLLAVPDASPKSPSSITNLQLEILSLGPLFGRYWSQQALNFTEENPTENKVEHSESQLFMNVSAEIRLTEKLYENFSVIFVEGLYNPAVGKMYLIGCRDVQASWKILHESVDLDAGLDCLVEVIVSYPPTTSRWLVDSTAKISISSQRTEDDPLYFTPIKLQTSSIMYRKQREDILSRRGVEGLLRVLTLSLAIACLLSQIFYIRVKLEDVPFISLVMLGIQGVGYSIPLITGAEAIIEKMSSEPYSYRYQSYALEKSQSIRAVEYMVKLLVLVAFLLTMRLCQKVWRSRIRLLTRAPLEPHRVPSDKRVLITTLIIHSVGCILVLFVHYLSSSQYRSLQSEMYVGQSGRSQTPREWETELGEYLGLIQDFFLLPQIIGNYIWKLNGKPLREFYYMGITAVRLLPHLYDFLRSPIPNLYFSDEYEFANPRLNFFSKFGDIAIPLIAILLAVVVYVQQRWNHAELSQRLSAGRASKVYERLGSKVYERLPSLSSMAFEAELSSGVNEAIVNENGRDRE